MITRRQLLTGAAGAGLLTAVPWLWTTHKSALAQAYTSRAFIGAEGYGAPTNGWRNASAQILFVTNLNETGAGSFRQAYMNTTGPRYIIFQVAGYIPVITELSNSAANTGNVYVAGQSAPGDGITFKNSSPGTNQGQLNARMGQTCLRYIRSRSSLNDGTNAWNMSFWSLDPNGHYIIDHCSMSFATDDAHANLGTANTVQYSIIGETIRDGHAVLVDHHGGGRTFTYHHNFFVSALQRSPLFSDGLGECINNLTYNWGGLSGLCAEFFNVYTTSPAPTYDVIGNYYKWGPTSGYFNAGDYNNPANAKEIIHGQPPGSIYLQDNMARLPSGFTAARVASYPSTGLTISASKLNAPTIPVTVDNITSAILADAWAANLLSHVGCSRPARDDNDDVIVASYSAYTGVSNPLSETGHLYALANGGNAYCTLATGSPAHLSPSGMTAEFISRMGLANTTESALSTSISQARGLNEDYQNIEWNLMEAAGDIDPLESGGGGVNIPRLRSLGGFRSAGGVRF